MSCHFWLMRKRRAADKKAQETVQDAVKDTSTEENANGKPSKRRQRTKKDDAE